MAGIVEHPTKASLVYVCLELLRQFNAGESKPHLNGVTMEHASGSGWCQQAVREAVEATIYGEEYCWPYSSCCAGQTGRRLKAAGLAVPREQMQSGDLVYFGGGGSCRTCGNPVGHTGVWVGNGLWQNTSAHNPHLGVWPVTDSQWDRLLGVFSILPAEEASAIKVIRQTATGPMVLTSRAEVRGDETWVPLGETMGRLGYALLDHIKDESKVYLIDA